MKNVNLYTKITILPSNLRAEVNDFIDFLLSKKANKTTTKKPVFGCLKDQIILNDDFNDPLEDFKEYTA